MKESQTTACDFQDLTTWKQIQNSIMQLFLQTCTPNIHQSKNNGVYYFVSPSGTRFALKSGPSVMIPEAQSTCLLGNYAGVSLETMDIKMSMKILQVLGFEQSGGGLDKGWVSCTDQAQNTISLMMPFTCPHLFVQH